MKPGKKIEQATFTATDVWTVDGIPTDDVDWTAHAVGWKIDATVAGEAAWATAGSLTYTPEAGWTSTDTSTAEADQMMVQSDAKAYNDVDEIIDHEGDWPPYLCLYEPGDPVSVEQIEEVILQFSQRPHHWNELKETKAVIRCIAGMSRIRPYCDELAREAIATMEAAWFCRTKRSAFELECAIAREEAVKLQRAIANRIAEARIAAENDSEPNTPEDSDENAHLEGQGSDERLIISPTPVLVIDVPAQSAGTIPSHAREPVKLFEFDTEPPCSAWMVHSSKNLRVLNASRYIKMFLQLKITSEQEPLLEKQARREALQLLFAGGRINIDDGKQFMSAFMEQQDLERQEVSASMHQLTESMNQTRIRGRQDSNNDNDNDNQSNFNLSDGEEFEEDEEELYDD